jgi:hypothetical protein
MGDNMRLNITTLVGAGAITAAFLFGGGALGHIATASALPNNGGGTNEWDIEAYDACVAEAKAHSGDISGALAACCWGTGGVYAGGKCGAPVDLVTTNPTGPQHRPTGTVPESNGEPPNQTPPKVSPPKVNVPKPNIVGPVQAAPSGPSNPGGGAGGLF